MPMAAQLAKSSERILVNARRAESPQCSRAIRARGPLQE